MKNLLLFLFLQCFSWQIASAQDHYGKKVVAELASDEMQGRGYVNLGGQKAADYLADQFEKWGAQKLGDSYFQKFTFGVNTFPDTVHVSIDGKELKPGADFIVDPGTPWIRKNYSVVHVKPSQWTSFSSSYKGRTDVMFAFDAKGITNKDSLKLLETTVQQTQKFAPVIRVKDKLTWSVATKLDDRALVEILREKWDTAAKTISLNIQSTFESKYEAVNVVGMIPGKSKKKKFIVVTAHYDHLGIMGRDAIFNGANDNASGNAMLLELMKYYSENRPDYTMLFIAFAGEEAGLLGSKYFVEHPMLDLKKIRFLINLDLLGTGEEGITVVNATKHEKEFELLKKINEKHSLLPQIKPRGPAANSDHYFFSEVGVPAFFIYTMGGSKAYHDINDRVEALSFAEFDDVSRLIREFVAGLK